LKESEGDPFTFYTAAEEEKQKKGKGRLVEENGEGEEEEEEEEEQEEEEEVVVEPDQEDQEENPTATQRLPKPPISAFEVDGGIFLPSQCENSHHMIACLHLLAPRWGDEGIAFHSLVKRVATLEVSV